MQTVGVLPLTVTTQVSALSTTSEVVVLVSSCALLSAWDWLLITGRGRLQNGKIVGPKLFAPPLG